ncbi:hypothetical protein LUZ61_009297 [Rhynchospora tenuis]|uniref:Uncharacterized protein n=1 Tax=Rhynchospora tenuis TaxID=198213 RepID=A0AAD5ZX56_9POAL|nr:hypothetical protein LUZ61_009297 [Rhynchospora tenuis]
MGRGCGSYEPHPKFRFDPHRSPFSKTNSNLSRLPGSVTVTSLQFPTLLKGDAEKDPTSSRAGKRLVSFDMATGDSKDVLKNVDWKTVGDTGTSTTTSSSTPIVKKRLPKKMRQVPDYYFMPRLSRPKAFVIYGACIAAGIGAGILGEIWIKKKIKEDGGVIWEIK